MWGKLFREYTQYSPLKEKLAFKNLLFFLNYFRDVYLNYHVWVKEK